ncbi:MAG: V-type ATPase subunit [Sphaerochaetaceae bacterium]|nr:V-type ATPase subunit [Sphaerochaetaceae bacterium]
MSDVSRYAFINAKLRARIGELHSNEIIEKMIKAPNLAEAVSVLAGTRHDSLYKVYDETGDIQMVELALFEEEVAFHRELIKYMDENTGNFVKVLMEKIEEANLKNEVRLWFAANVLHHHISYHSSYVDKEKIVNSIDYYKIINAISYDEIVKALEGTPYHSIFSKFSNKDISKFGLFPLENMLDHLWYERLFASFDDLSSKDEKVARSIYLVDVDIKNMLALIRYGLYYEFNKKELEQVFIPLGSVYKALKLEMDAGIFKLSSASRIIKRLYPDSAPILLSMDKSEHPELTHSDIAHKTLSLEHYLSEKRKKEFTKILSGDPFTIGTMLAYIFLRKAEDNMIKGILSAKYYHWEEEKIRRELD